MGGKTAIALGLVAGLVVGGLIVGGVVALVPAAPPCRHPPRPRPPPHPPRQRPVAPAATEAPSGRHRAAAAPVASPAPASERRPRRARPRRSASASPPRPSSCPLAGGGTVDLADVSGQARLGQLHGDLVARPAWTSCRLDGRAPPRATRTTGRCVGASPVDVARGRGGPWPSAFLTGASRRRRSPVGLGHRRRPRQRCGLGRAAAPARSHFWIDAGRDASADGRAGRRSDPDSDGGRGPARTILPG